MVVNLSNFFEPCANVGGSYSCSQPIFKLTWCEKSLFHLAPREDILQAWIEDMTGGAALSCDLSGCKEKFNVKMLNVRVHYSLQHRAYSLLVLIPLQPPLSLCE